MSETRKPDTVDFDEAGGIQSKQIHPKGIRKVVQKADGFKILLLEAGTVEEFYAALKKDIEETMRRSCERCGNEIIPPKVICSKCEEELR